MSYWSLAYDTYWFEREECRPAGVRQTQVGPASRWSALGPGAERRSGEGHTFSCRFRSRAQMPIIGEGAEASQDDPGIPGRMACGHLGKFGAVTGDPADRAEQTCGDQVRIFGGSGSQGGEEDEPGLAFAGVW